jgi:hypothetical protein
MAYIGNEPGVGSFIIATERFNGTGACTQFTISQTGISDANAIEVIVSSVQQDPINSYSIASGVITFTEAPPSGTQNIIVTYRATTVITYTNIQNSQIPDGTISATKLASGVLPTATANSAASYANSAFAVANTGAGAVTSGSYANSGFAVANSAASYANSAFDVANNNTGINTTQNTNITTAASYANSGFAVANSAASYANGAFTKANSVVTSIVAGTGISVSGATGAVTVSATSGGVTSLNGQSGAIVETNYGAIGSYVIAAENNGSANLISVDFPVNGTCAGSTLSRFTWTSGQNESIQMNLGASNSYTFMWLMSGMTNLGLTGTWRRMTRSIQDIYNGPAGGINLYVRIS